MVKEKEKRRYIERCFGYAEARKLFNLEDEEMFLDVYYDKSKNKIIVKTIVSYDESKGDI